MQILALDPANNCGWAVNICGGVYISGVWRLDAKRDESKGSALLRFRGKLAETKQLMNGFDLVVFEAARNAAPKMQGALVHQAKIQGVLEAWCAENSIEYRGYSPSEIKKHATGSGNAKKAQMLEAAKARYGYQGDSDDEADAICLLHLAIEEYSAFVIKPEEMKDERQGKGDLRKVPR